MYVFGFSHPLKENRNRYQKASLSDGVSRQRERQRRGGIRVVN